MRHERSANDSGASSAATELALTMTPSSHAMSSFDPSTIQWREPWQRISPEYAPKAEAELHREMCAGHVLFGRSVIAIGNRIDCDDILFYLGDSPPQFAVVHLTFQPESDPTWPQTVLYDSLTAWVEQCMIPDAEEYAL